MVGRWLWLGPQAGPVLGPVSDLWQVLPGAMLPEPGRFHQSACNAWACPKGITLVVGEGRDALQARPQYCSTQ